MLNSVSFNNIFHAKASQSIKQKTFTENLLQSLGG